MLSWLLSCFCPRGEDKGESELEGGGTADGKLSYMRQLSEINCETHIYETDSNFVD